MVKELTENVKDEQALKDRLVELSRKYGGAWVFSIRAFSHTVEFAQFQSPSRVPDHYHDLTRNLMAYKGKLQGFTPAARRRERNRGIGRG